MNHLDLVQRLVYDSGASGSSLAISTTVGQRGDALNFVNWTSDAWREIQGLLNWPALWEEASVPVVANAATVAQSLPHKRYVKTGAKLTDDVTGQAYALDYAPWHEFREVYTSATSGAFTAAVRASSSVPSGSVMMKSRSNSFSMSCCACDRRTLC